MLNPAHALDPSHVFDPFLPPGKGAKDYDIKTSNFFTNIIKESVPAVVFIQSKSSSSNWISSFWKNNEEKSCIGSGFLITHNGFIITNEHVVKDANSINVILNNQLEYSATLIGSDPTTDIALIKIEAKNLPFLTFADSDALELGEWVTAIGNPFGLQSTVTFGIISNLRENISEEPDTLQVNLSIYPGNSGGPLLNLYGKVIGINRSTWRYKEGHYTGLSFAIPSNAAQKSIEKIFHQASY